MFLPLNWTVRDREARDRMIDLMGTDLSACMGNWTRRQNLLTVTVWQDDYAVGYLHVNQMSHACKDFGLH